MTKFFSGAIKPMLSGQKTAAVDNEPKLIANSTNGKFQLTPAVTRAMNIARGEYVKFFNDSEEVEKQVNAGTPEALKAAEQLGIDISTPAGKADLIAKCTTYFIAKGWAKLDNTGAIMQASARLTKDDKEDIIAERGAELIADRKLRAELIERVGNPDASDDELIAALTVDDVNISIDAYEGSKTASTSTATGTGLLLSFTDTAIWNVLKADLENKTSKNRIFKVLLNDPTTASVHNGYQHIDVVAYPIEFVEDTDPIRLGEKHDEE